MYKTHSSLHKSLDRTNNHSKSLHNFVLLNKNREVQQNYQWKPLRVKQALIQRSSSLNKQISFGGSYSKKKSILLTLNQPQQNSLLNSQRTQNQSSSKTSINTEIFLKSKLNLKLKDESTPSNERNKNETAINFPQQIGKMEQKFNKFTNTSTFFNQKVQKGIEKFKVSSMSTKISQKTMPKLGKNLSQQINKANSLGMKIIGILTMKRYRLRIRLKHTFGRVCVCQNTLHQKEHEFSCNKKINDLVKEMLSMKESDEKPLYFFHLNKQPLVCSNELSESENVILASSSPLLNIDNEFHFKIYEQAQKIGKFIKSIQEKIDIDMSKFSSDKKIPNRDLYRSPTKRQNNQDENEDEQDNQTTRYDWEVISNINDYIEQIVQNPEKVRSSSDADINKIASLKHQIRQLYNEKFDTVTKQETGQNFRNPLLQDHSHYHSELKQKKVLSAISCKLQQQDFIKNKHILKRPTIEELIQQDKRQKEKQLQDIKNPNIINRNIKNTLTSKKSIIRQLDQKNTLLFEQNIPYLMDKYGINRYEIHNLFTIYKTLQKISGMKFKDNDNAAKILKKGIDRSTFDQGMKRLDINPGDQVIKNICYFDDFISWEQFLKIVSIGLRKTPEQKLEAILFGIGGTNKGCLTKNQISIMIGNSLNKIFDSEQSQLKEYFTEVAMRDLDSDGSGTVDVNEIKRKCLSVGKIDLENGQNMDLITFLLLNS